MGSEVLAEAARATAAAVETGPTRTNGELKCLPWSGPALGGGAVAGLRPAASRSGFARQGSFAAWQAAHHAGEQQALSVVG